VRTGFAETVHASHQKSAAPRKIAKAEGPEGGKKEPAPNAAWSYLVTGPLVQRNCAKSEKCPKDFCEPFPTKKEAEDDRDFEQPGILSQVGIMVVDGGSDKAKAQYKQFLEGGKAHADLSTELAAYFTKSSATSKALTYLEGELETYFKANPPPKGGSSTVDIAVAIPEAIKTLGKAGDANSLSFSDYSETPGILAGGVGTGQVACAVGAIPSTVEDTRSATGTATAFNSGGELHITPSIEFSATDTLDFCPGNCGGGLAQGLTVPMSRYEATKISGDVAFTVKFPAPVHVGAHDSEDG
jgi:hypothetical protein